MNTQRKFYLGELEWLDENEPFYRDAFVTQHYVPLTEELNSRTKQNFSPTTVRNRLRSYRNWNNRKKLVKGAKTVDLTVVPEKTIKKEEKGKGYLHDRPGLRSERSNFASVEEEAIKSLFPDISMIDNIADDYKEKDYRTSVINHYISKEKTPVKIENSTEDQPRHSRSTKTNLQQVK